MERNSFSQQHAHHGKTEFYKNVPRNSDPFGTIIVVGLAIVTSSKCLESH